MTTPSKSPAATKRNFNSGITAPKSAPQWGATDAQFASAIRRVEAMTMEEKIQSLIDAGILTKKRKLAKQYRASA